MKTEPDAIIEVMFLTTEEGGRKSPVFDADKGRYRPIFEIDGQCHCGCFLGPAGCMEFGKTYEAPVIFLWPELVIPKLFEGKTFTIRESKKVATAKVIRILCKL